MRDREEGKQELAEKGRRERRGGRETKRKQQLAEKGGRERGGKGGREGGEGGPREVSRENYFCYHKQTHNET